MLSRVAFMVQAAVLDDEFLDLLPPFDDGGVPAEVDVGGGNVVQVSYPPKIAPLCREFREAYGMAWKRY
jgi:hypothetical protein